MKSLSKSFTGLASQDSPHFPNYLQPTKASHNKSAKSLTKPNKNHIGRSFIYKQENINGPIELSGKKKLLKNDSGASLINLLERSDPYLIKQKRNQSPKQSKNTYRIYMPEFNCETPKFHGLRTYYNDFVVVSPISNSVLGPKPKNQEKVYINERKIIEKNKENTVPCLPFAHQEKKLGKKTYKNVIENKKIMKNLIQGNYSKAPAENSSINEETIYKKPRKMPFLEETDRISPIKLLNKAQNQKTFKHINILPEGIEKIVKKGVFKYPNQKRILGGDTAFWDNFKNRDNSGFRINESKITNHNYHEYVKFMKKEKESLEKYLNQESLNNSQTSLCKGEREHQKKQFPQSPIFRNNFEFG